MQREREREREASRGGDNGEAAEKIAVGEIEATTARAAERSGIGDEGEEAGGGGGGGHGRMPLCMATDAPKERRDEGLQNPYLSDKVSASSRSLGPMPSRHASVGLDTHTH